MKKLITTFGFIIVALLGVAQGNYPVSVGYGMTEAAKLRARVQDSSGTYQYNVIPHELSELKSYGITPVFYYAPAAVSTGVTYSQYPLDGSGDFTVSRTSAATVIGESGYIQDIAANIAKINYLDNGIPSLTTEGQVTNLITYSNEFGNSYWTKSGAKIEGDASTAGSELVTNGDMESGLATLNSIGFSDFQTTTTHSNTFAYSGTYSQKSALTSTGGVVHLNPNDATLSGKYLLIDFWVYVPTGMTSLIVRKKSSGVTSIINTITERDYWINVSYYTYYDQSTSDRLIEFSLSGAVTDAFYLDNVSVKQVTGYPSPHLDSSGNVRTDAYKLVESSGGTIHYIYTSSITVTNGIDVTYSVYAKSGERDYITIGNTASSSKYAEVQFDLSSGTKVYEVDNTYSVIDSDIKEIINGWYKCSITFQSTETTFYPVIILGDDVWTSGSSYSNLYTGDGTSGIYIYGANLTATDYPASFIETSGTTATMTADSKPTVEVDSYSSGAIQYNDYVQNLSTTTGTTFYLTEKVSKAVYYNRELTSTEITGIGATEAVYITPYLSSDIPLTLTVSGTGTCYWGDGESDAYDGTDVVLTHTFSDLSEGIVFVGTLTKLRNTTSNSLLNGDIANLPSGITYYANQGLNTTSGDIANLPSGITTYINAGQNTTSGDIANLPSGVTYYFNTGQNTTSGDIANLPSGLTYYNNTGQNTTSGDIANLPSGLTYYNNTGQNQVDTYTSGHTFSSSITRFHHSPASGYGLSSTEVDNLLIDLDASGMSSGTIDLAGNNAARTSASDAAVSSLTGKGVSVTTN